MEVIKGFLAIYWPILSIMVGIVVIAALIRVYRDVFMFSWFSMMNHFPYFGRIAQWSRKPREIDEHGHWKGESEIANSYFVFYEKFTEGPEFYKKSEDYLMKAAEQNRKPKGFLLWVMVGLLVVAEAAAFGLALAPYALTFSATPNMAAGGALVIGVLISCAALLLSEKTGHQAYSNRMVNQVMSYTTVREGGKRGDLHASKLLNISNTYDDAKDPRYQQILNRFEPDRDAATGVPQKSYRVTGAYVFFILMLAVAAFFVRSKTLDAQETDLIDNSSSAFSQQADDFPSLDSIIPVPSGAADLAQNAANKTAEDKIEALHTASLITFAVLSGLFLFIQVASTYLAYAYGFVGSQSEKAYKTIRHFKDANDLVRHNDREANIVATAAQKSINKLSTMIGNTVFVSGDDSEMSRKKPCVFSEYVKMRANQKIIASTVTMYTAQVNTLINNISTLNSQGNYDEAAAQMANLAKCVSLIPDGLLPDEIMAQAKGYTAKLANIQAPAPVAAPAAPVPAPVVAAPAPTPAPVTPVTEVVAAPAPEAVAAPQPVAAVAQAPAAAQGDDIYAHGDLLDYDLEDIPALARMKGVDENILRRHFKKQQLKAQEAS